MEDIECTYWNEAMFNEFVHQMLSLFFEGED